PFALAHRIVSCVRCLPSLSCAARNDFTSSSWTHCRSVRHATTCRLLGHPYDDLVFSEGQHRAGARAFQVHITPASFSTHKSLLPDELRPALAGALRVSARNIGDAGELVDRARGADFLDPATRAHNRAEHFEGIGAPLVLQGAVTGADARDEVLDD